MKSLTLKGKRDNNTSIHVFSILFNLFFIQQVLISHPFYTHQCIHVNHNGPIYSSPLHCYFWRQITSCTTRVIYAFLAFLSKDAQMRDSTDESVSFRGPFKSSLYIYRNTKGDVYFLDWENTKSSIAINRQRIKVLEWTMTWVK